MRDRGRRVAHRLVVGDALAHRAAFRVAGLVIAEVDAALDAVEKRRRQGDVAVRGEPVGHRTHVPVDAEDLLDDDETAAWVSRRHREVAVELMAVGSRQLDPLAHGLPHTLKRKWKTSPS